MTKAEFYEFFLQEFRHIEDEKDDLMQKLRRGRNLWVISQRLAELEIRSNELDKIFIKLKGWF